MAQWLTNRTSIHEEFNPWLWLWCRLATAAPIGPLAWEPPHAACVALKKKTKKTPKKLVHLVVNVYYKNCFDT